jgi:TDG/mug DNA glycosylase family protein
VELSPPEAVPLRLWSLHQLQPVGAEVVFDLDRDWPAQRVLDVVRGGGFTLLESTDRGRRWRVRVRRERTLADTVGAGMRLVCVGLNPSLYAADAGVGFARPGNRFWPAMLEAGLVASARDPLAALVDHGIGMTDLVKRATVRADELTTVEYDEGLGRVDRLASWLRPAAVCIIGLDGWRKVVDRRATPGWQQRNVGGRPAYLMPNPSGLNAHARVTDLADHFRAAFRPPPDDPPGPARPRSAPAPRPRPPRSWPES